VRSALAKGLHKATGSLAQADARKLLDLVRRDPRRTAAYYAEQLGITEERAVATLDELERLGALGSGPAPTPKEAS
jgi:hypothetical protein